MTSPSHNQEQDWRKAEFKYDRYFYEITFSIMVVVIVILVGFTLFPDDRGFQGNLFTTILGVLITIVVLDRRAERRERKREEQEFKNRLIRELWSSVDESRKRAAEELWVHEWLWDETLLSGTKLQGINMSYGSMRYANIVGVNVSDSILVGTDLANTNLNEVNLSNTNLQFSTLTASTIRLCNLQGADFYQADLLGAKISFVVIDSKTILPDGTNWTSETNMRRFTDPAHPEFWRSDNPRSPAYRAKGNK